MLHDVFRAVRGDPARLARLLREPADMLREAQVNTPEHGHIVVFVDDAVTAHLVIPYVPDIQAEDLERSLGSAFGSVVAQANADPDFARRLEQAPGAILAEAGMGRAGDIRLVVAVDREDCVHVVVPLAPEGDDLDERWRYAVAGSMLAPRPGR